MSNKNLAQEFLEAVKIIAADSVNSANMDQTVLMQVTKVPTETNKTYEVKYQDQTYSNVLSASSWDKDDFVYVICPEGIDSTAQKTIISGLPKHKEIRETISTFEDIYQIIGAQARTNSVDFYPGGEATWYDINTNSFVIDKELLLAYLKRGNGLVISADFLTTFPNAFFQHEDSEKCNFGIEVVLKVNNEDKVEEVSYILDVNNMEGYPYLFTTATKQTEYFVIEHPENIVDLVSIKGFFKDCPISSTVNNPIKVTMSNFSFCAFYDYRKQTENKLIIFTKDNLQSIENISNYSNTQTTLETIFFSKQKFKEIKYQWNKNDVLISSNETSQSLAIPGGALLSENNKITCIATIDNKDKYSNSYTIQNNSPLEVVAATIRQTDNIDYYTISVAPTDTSIYSYQWAKIGANGIQTSLSQTGASIVNIDATKINSSDTYKCLISYKYNDINYPIVYVEATVVQLIYSYSRTGIWFTASATTTLPASSIWVTDSTETDWSADNKYLWKREDIYVAALGMEKLSIQGVPYISSVWGETGGSGNSAQLLRLQTSSYIFTRTKNGTGYKEDAITITAELINITEDGDGITWTVDGKTNPEGENIIINKKDHALTIKNSYLEDDTQKITIKASEDGKEDSLTISVLDEGNDAWSVIVTNPVMNFNTNSETPESESSDIYVYMGGIKIPYWKQETEADQFFFYVRFEDDAQSDHFATDSIDAESGRVTLSYYSAPRKVQILVQVFTKGKNPEPSTPDEAIKNEPYHAEYFYFYCTTVENGIDSYSLSLDNDSDIIVKDTTGKWISSFPITITATRYIGNKESDEGSIIIAPSSGTGWSSSQNGVLTITSDLPIDTQNKEFTFTWKDDGNKTLDVKKFTLGVTTSNADYELIADKTVINIDENKDSKINFKVKVKDNQGIHNATRSEIVNATTPFWFKEVYSDGTLSDVIYPKAGEDNSEAVWEVGPFTKDSVFRLYQPIQNNGIWENGFKWDEETIEVVRNGVSIQGDPAYFIDLNNDSDVIARNNAGEIISDMPEVLATLMAGANSIAVTSSNLILETNREETGDSKWWSFDIENNKGKLTFNKSKMPTTESLDGTFTFKWTINNDTTITKDFTLRGIASNVDYDLICSATSVNNSNGSGTITFSVLKKSNTTTTLSAPSDDEPIAIYLNGSTTPLTAWKLDWNTETQKTQVQLKSADITWDEETIEFVQDGSPGKSLQIQYQNTESSDKLNENDWQTSIPTFEAGKKTFMRQRVGDNGFWTSPIQISAEDGDTPTITINENGYWVINGETSSIKAEGQDGDTPTITINENGQWVINGSSTGINATGPAGKDGSNIEYIYYRSAEPQTFSNPPTGVGNGWTASPQGITNILKYEYVSIRTKAAGIDTTWTAFSTPVIWAKWGEKGFDGDGVEYKYYLKNEEAEPTYSNSDTHWTDEPTGVSALNRFEYVAVIATKHDAEGQPSTTTTVALWSKYSLDGTSVSLSSTEYLAYHSNTQPNENNSNWNIDISQAITSANNPYLWKKQIFSDGSKVYSYEYHSYEVTKYLYKGAIDLSVTAPTWDGTNTPSDGWSENVPVYTSANGNNIFIFRSEQKAINTQLSGTGWSNPLLYKYKGQLVSTNEATFLELTNGGDKLGVFEKKTEEGDIEYLGINASYIKSGALEVSDDNGLLIFKASNGGTDVDGNALDKELYLGGFQVKGIGQNEGYISKGKNTYNDNLQGVYLGTDGIGLGQNKFTVNREGYLHSESGDIAGWEISDTLLRSGNLALTGKIEDSIYYKYSSLITPDTTSNIMISTGPNSNLGFTELTVLQLTATSSSSGSHVKEYSFYTNQDTVFTGYVIGEFYLDDNMSSSKIERLDITNNFVWDSAERRYYVSFKMSDSGEVISFQVDGVTYYYNVSPKVEVSYYNINRTYMLLNDGSCYCSALSFLNLPENSQFVLNNNGISLDKSFYLSGTKYNQQMRISQRGLTFTIPKVYDTINYYRVGTTKNYIQWTWDRNTQQEIVTFHGTGWNFTAQTAATVDED